MSRVSRPTRPSVYVKALVNESGAALVEFAIALPIFLMLLFALIDFGRLGFSIVMARSAIDLAVRTAVVRPPACVGWNDPTSSNYVPTSNTRGSDTTPPFGTSCSFAAGVCAAPATVSCVGNASDASAVQIWNAVAPLMPYGTSISNLSFTYSYDPNLGFLGGPYVPKVSVTLMAATFQFVTPLGALTQLFMGTGSGFNTAGGLNYPSLSASLPGEDLAEGNGG